MKVSPFVAAWGLGAVLSIAAATTYAEVGYPTGLRNFETMGVGDDVATLGWEVVNTSAPPTNFTIQGSNLIAGSPGVHGSSTRWLKIVDIDGANVQNRFYTPAIIASHIQGGYEWQYYVNLETTPPGGASVKPKLTIQHFDNNAGALRQRLGDRVHRHGREPDRAGERRYRGLRRVLSAKRGHSRGPVGENLGTG